MPAATHIGTSVVALAANAPIHTAGHSARPHNSSAACAMPVGAQTVVTCSATTESWKPRTAVTT